MNRHYAACRTDHTRNPIKLLGPVQPMAKEDRAFWRIWGARREQKGQRHG
jgi:hypothetical protein